MVTYNNHIRFLKFATLYSCTIDLILEELKEKGESDIKKSGPHACFSGIIFTIKCLIQTKFTQQQVNIQHFVTGVLYLCKTEVNSLNIHVPKKCHYFCTGVYRVVIFAEVFRVLWLIILPMFRNRGLTTCPMHVGPFPFLQVYYK